MNRAEWSQYLLDSVGIDVETDPDNQVLLSSRFHRHIHTSAYCESLDWLLTGVYLYSKPFGEEVLEKNMRRTLNHLATVLTVLDKLVVGG